MISKKKAQECGNSATDIIRDVMKKLWICRIALAISLIANSIQAVIIFKQNK